MEEIVQDSLAVISEKYRQIEIEISFSAWAYRVLENKILEYYRKKHGRENALARHGDMSLTPEAAIPEPTLKRQLLDCLEKLCHANIRQARVLNMHYQGYRIDEICSKLNLTRNNLYILLSRARSTLKKCLETGDIS